MLKSKFQEVQKVLSVTCKLNSFFKGVQICDNLPQVINTETDETKFVCGKRLLNALSNAEDNCNYALTEEYDPTPNHPSFNSGASPSLLHQNFGQSPNITLVIIPGQ